jgi:hypothetical protein
MFVVTALEKGVALLYARKVTRRTKVGMRGYLR